MPRIRTIKPDHWNDRKLVDISLQAHLLWIGTWNFSDDKGIFDGDPLLIKSQIFPRRSDVRVEQISQWLDQLVEARYIIPFNHTDGQGYFISRTFGTHQRIDKPQPSKFDDHFIKKLFQEHSGNDPGTFLPVVESKGKESIVRESNTPAPDLSGSNLYRKPVIPTIEKVKEKFFARGGTEEMAEKFFEVNEATGWFYRGSPITNFVNLVPGYIESWKKNDENGKSQRGTKNSKSAGASQLTQQLAAKIDALGGANP